MPKFQERELDSTFWWGKQSHDAKEHVEGRHCCVNFWKIQSAVIFTPILSLFHHIELYFVRGQSFSAGLKWSGNEEKKNLPNVLNAFRKKITLPRGNFMSNKS